MKIKYVYFVSYKFVDGGKYGFGRDEIYSSKPITTSTILCEIENYLKKKTGFESLCIDNFKLLNTRKQS